MNILLTGASGFIGSNIAAVLMGAGHRIVPVSRRHGIDYARLQTAADWLPYLEGIDAVVNAVGIIGETAGQTFEQLHTRGPAALFQACHKASVRRVVQMSALGADNTAFSAYHLSKRAADDALRGLPLDWFVLRPSLVYGRGGTSTAFLLRLARLSWMPVLGDGQQALQPVHVSDVAATVLRCLAAPDVRQTLDVVGPEAISFASWLQILRRAQGLAPGRFLYVPGALAVALAALGRHFSPLLRRDNVRMLQVGYKADPRALEHWLGRRALAVTPELLFTNAISAGSTP